MDMRPTFAVLAPIATLSVALALRVWPVSTEVPVAQRFDDLPPNHPQ